MNKENIKQLAFSDLIRYFLRVVEKHKEIELNLKKESFRLKLQQVQNLRKELKMWGGEIEKCEARLLHFDILISYEDIKSKKLDLETEIKKQKAENDRLE